MSGTHRGHHSFSRRPHGNDNKPKGCVVEEQEIKCGDKTFKVRGLSNFRGKAVEVRERASGRENILVIPVEGVEPVFNAIASVLTQLNNE